MTTISSISAGIGPSLYANTSVKDGKKNFINDLFDNFANAKVEGKSFHDHLNEKIADLGTGDSSNPQKLAMYQKAIMMFTVHTNAQSSMIKSIADLDKGIVRDFN